MFRWGPGGSFGESFICDVITRTSQPTGAEPGAATCRSSRGSGRLGVVDSLGNRIIAQCASGSEGYLKDIPQRPRFNTSEHPERT